MSGLFETFGRGETSGVERWADRFLGAVEEVAGSVQKASGRAAEVAGAARRSTGAGLRVARDRAQLGRDALTERVDVIRRRAGEIRARRERRRSLQRERRVHGRRASPLHLDVSRAKRVVLRGQRPVNLQMPDGETIRYRYYRRPSLAQRVLLRLTGRQVWPPR